MYLSFLLHIYIYIYINNYKIPYSLIFQENNYNYFMLQCSAVQWEGLIGLGLGVSMQLLDHACMERHKLLKLMKEC